MLGRIAAGGPILAEQAVEDVFPLPRELVGEGEVFMLQVKGDSMIEAAICDGDWVVVRQQPTANNGEIVAAMIDGEATVKTYRRRDGHVWLMPAERRPSTRSPATTRPSWAGSWRCCAASDPTCPPGTAGGRAPRRHRARVALSRGRADQPDDRSAAAAAPALTRPSRGRCRCRGRRHAVPCGRAALDRPGRAAGLAGRSAGSRCTVVGVAAVRPAVGVTVVGLAVRAGVAVPAVAAAVRTYPSPPAGG